MLRWAFNIASALSLVLLVIALMIFLRARQTYGVNPVCTIVGQTGEALTTPPKVRRFIATPPSTAFGYSSVAHSTTGSTDDLYVRRLGDRDAAANSLRKSV